MYCLRLSASPCSGPCSGPRRPSFFVAAARGGVGVSETSVRLSAAGSSCRAASYCRASRSASRDYCGATVCQTASCLLRLFLSSSKCLLASVLQAASHAKPKRAGSPGSRTPGRHPLKLTHRRWLITDPASQTIADGGQHHRLGHGRAERQMGRRGPDGRKTHFGVPTASPSDLVLKFM